ncbi:MAG: rod shape-determining protein MreD [Treponema sp.]|jgi:rod shape-determining protein MreD|nr:rod shape-determining protein MreD [Treponema sp.]
MVKKIVWGCVFILVAALLQSTVFLRLVVYLRAIPDMALCILVYSAYVNGIMTGQFTGFFSGLLLDFFSASPLGLNSLTRTIVGAVTGLLKDTFILDHFFLPMILCAGATILKALLYWLLGLVFPEAVPSYAFYNLTFWIELGMNALLAPIIFAILGLFRPLRPKQKENMP